jgi:hypothetical protein
MPRHNERWTPAQRERLVQMWGQGYTAREIYLSGEFPPFSRNAIIGQVHRLRKKLGAEIVTLHGTEPPPPPPKKKRQRAAGARVNGPLVLREATPLRAPPSPPKARRLTLLALGPKDCRFIVTDHQTRVHLYCAVDASAYAGDDGSNCYCAFHQRFMHASGFAR